jgi:hypothetical protein
MGFLCTLFLIFRNLEKKEKIYIYKDSWAQETKPIIIMMKNKNIQDTKIDTMWIHSSRYLV